MNETQFPARMSRRDFLKLAAIAGFVAAGGYVVSEYAPWLNYDDQVAFGLRPFSENLTVSAEMRELVRYATLAANGHNTQPWKFAIRTDSIEIRPDYSRRLPVVDPNDRELWISLGCALENLLVTARSIGYAPEVTYPSSMDFIQIRLAKDTSQVSPLYDAIPRRQNTRSEFDGRAIPSADLDELQSLPLEPGITLRYTTSRSDLETMLEFVNQGNLSQYADRAFLDELISWLRFNKKEALDSLDGLYTRASGNPEVSRWLGRMFVGGTKPQQQADIDAAKLRSSPGAVVVASDSDDKTTWVRTGQVYERLALTMTSLDVKSAFLNQPIEVADLRSQFQTAMGLGLSLPQLLVRFGYAEAMPRSLRRPVDEVIIKGGM